MDDKAGIEGNGRFGITEKRTKADEFYPANHLKFKSYSDDDYFRRILSDQQRR